MYDMNTRGGTLKKAADSTAEFAIFATPAALLLFKLQAEKL